MLTAFFNMSRSNLISFNSFLQAYTIIEGYIKWYNYQRLHSSLNFKTPAEKELEMKIKTINKSA